MRRIAKASFVGSSVLLILGCLSTSARAQNCGNVCPTGQGGGPNGYPWCDTQCNNGGGDYTTCGGAGYDCCINAISEHEIGSRAEAVIEGLWCSKTAIVINEWITVCPDQTYEHPPAWCEEVDDGHFSIMGGSCSSYSWGYLYC